MRIERATRRSKVLNQLARHPALSYRPVLEPRSEVTNPDPDNDYIIGQFLGDRFVGIAN